MSTVETTIADGRVAGSFRDPSGYVFQRNGRVFRAIDSECLETLQSLRGRGLFKKLIDDELHLLVIEIQTSHEILCGLDISVAHP